MTIQSRERLSAIPVELIALANEQGDISHHFPYETYVFRFAVPGGWIVGTAIGSGGTSYSQSFIPDPDHIWNPVLTLNAKTSDPESQR